MARLATGRPSASSLLSYGLTVLPSVARELSRWRARASAIPDARLRRLALGALGKRGNMEGAALFAVLAPRGARVQAARALVAFQAAYNYADLLAEQPNADPSANARRLHDVLLDALEPRGARGGRGDDHHRLGARGEDGDFLLELRDCARASVSALPSYPLVARSARAAATRIVDYQRLNLGECQGSSEGLERWGRAQTPAGSGLRWWETAAAGGSSLGVHVMIGLAADPHLDEGELAVTERAYFPWIGALHSLLDSVVDVEEDRSEGQRNLLGYYASREDAAARMAAIARRARSKAVALPRGRLHETILTAMAGYYLSAPQAAAQDVGPIVSSVARAAGPAVKPALPLFRAARLVSQIARERPARAVA